MVSNRNADALRQQGIDDPDTIVTFSIKYYYTRQFAAVTDDIELYMDQVSKYLIRIFILGINYLPENNYNQPE
jgi:hypothetical protein